MEKQFELLRATRKNILEVLESTDRELLFTIPDGYKNHIFWNIMHVIASQQLLTYGLSGLPFQIEKELIMSYRSGTTPQPNPPIELIDTARSLLSSCVTKTIEDYQGGFFKSYKEVEVSYGLKLKNIEDAIHFNNLHEAMHLGQIKCMKQLLLCKQLIQE